MVIIKTRVRSKELQVLELLNARMKLSNKDRQYYYKLKKGYEGEVLFDSLTEKLTCDCFILNDLLLKVNNTLFQIDSLIITANEIYLYEIKNMDGDYYYDSELDRFFKMPHSEITNPLHQLTRSESLLRNLLFYYGYQLPINAFLIFINSEFTLYQSPIHRPIIYPTQIYRHLQKLDQIPMKLNKNNRTLAQKLVSLHVKESPFSQIPSYTLDQLQKGIYCSKCRSFSISHKGKNCICMKCNNMELLEDSIIRMVEEFKTLFPEKRITTNIIHDWCQIVESKFVIRKILNNNFKRFGKKRWTYYE